MSPAECAALERLLEIARHDTGQGGRVASFLLAWWNAPSCGGFDLTDLWPVDESIRLDMLTVLGFVSRNTGKYPDVLGYGEAFRRVIERWRPSLLE